MIRLTLALLLYVHLRTWDASAYIVFAAGCGLLLALFSYDEWRQEHGFTIYSSADSLPPWAQDGQALTARLKDEKKHGGQEVEK